MATREIFFFFTFAMSLNLIVTIENTDVDHENERDVRVVGRAYSLTGCNYEDQAGYTCLSCHRALHCYIGGAAVMVDCYGLFRYCRDGRCSRKQGAKCSEDTKLTTEATLLSVTSHQASVASVNLNVATEAISTANGVK